MTTRGMQEKQMAQIADMITRVLRDINNEKTITEVRSEARALCDQFPLYPDMV
jgi:glycine hydroxymethyltransferase